MIILISKFLLREWEQWLVNILKHRRINKKILNKSKYKHTKIKPAYITLVQKCFIKVGKMKIVAW